MILTEPEMTYLDVGIDTEPADALDDVIDVSATPLDSEEAFATTVSGKRVSYDHPTPDQIDLEDIAQALANICRSSGNIPEFYSIAQHSVLVSHLVPQTGTLPLQGLLHDAAEFVMTDVPTPLKRKLPLYKDIERRLYAAIAQTVLLPGTLDPEIKLADQRADRHEQHTFYRAPRPDVLPYALPAELRALPWTTQALAPEPARKLFRDRLLELLCAPGEPEPQVSESRVLTSGENI